MALLHPLLGGDQSTMRQGFLRAAVMSKTGGALWGIFPRPTLYFWQDADAILSGGNGIGGLPTGIHPLTDATLWTTWEVNLPFHPTEVSSQLVRDCGFGMGNSAASRTSRLFRDQVGTYRYFVNPGVSDSAQIGANLVFNTWPGLGALFVDSIRFEVDWALRFLDFAGKRTREAENRAQLLIRYAHEAARSSADVGSAFHALGRRILGSQLNRVDFSSSTSAWRLDKYTDAPDGWFSVLKRFIEDPTLVGAYNAATHENRKNHQQGELPFWVITRTGGALRRTTLNTGQLGNTVSARAIFERYGREVIVVPKAVLLLLQLCQIGHPYMTKLDYAPDTARVAQALSLPMRHGYTVTFDLKRALGGLWPQDLDFWPKDTGIPAEVIRWAKQRTLRYWQQRPTLIFAFVVGGVPLLDTLIAGARVERHTW